jgi:hypothetical protein
LGNRLVTDVHHRHTPAAIDMRQSRGTRLRRYAASAGRPSHLRTSHYRTSHRCRTSHRRASHRRTVALSHRRTSHRRTVALSHRRTVLRCVLFVPLREIKRQTLQ